MQISADTPRVAIIGMGSRGLSVLEQLLAVARLRPSQPLRIEVFDPQPAGSGVHSTEQPDYLMLNTMAGQLSAFSSAYPANSQAQPPGPTFFQWCMAQGLCLDERGHVSEPGRGQPIAWGDFVPRTLLGRYLQDSYRYLLDICPAHVQVQHCREQVVACRPLHGRPGFALHSGGGHVTEVDAVFLTSGHAAPSMAAPIGERVAIEGLGLTAMDTLAALTQGRGGQYVRDDSAHGWRYQASGREPQIYLRSRSGLPFHARPQWQPGTHVAAPRLFFSAAAVSALRRNSGNGQLDFRQQVLPLIEDEMRAVFYQAKAQQQGVECLAEVRQRLQAAITPALRQPLFVALAAQLGNFNPQDYLRCEPWQGKAERYATWFRQWIADDLAFSRLGVGRSPLRQALEVWRDYRDVLRLVADHDGLNENSTLAFFSTWAALSNRLVGGPQKERYEDLMALIDAGIVIPLAPTAEVSVDTRLAARVAHSGLTLNRAALMVDLLRQGLIKAAHAYPADGIAIDRQSRALRSDGSVHERLWALGPGVEGSTFYNHYVPTPDPACRALLEAREAAESCLSALNTHSQLHAVL